MLQQVIGHQRRGLRLQTALRQLQIRKLALDVELVLPARSSLSEAHQPGIFALLFKILKRKSLQPQLTRFSAQVILRSLHLLRITGAAAVKLEMNLSLLVAVQHLLHIPRSQAAKIQAVWKADQIGCEAVPAHM